jgi:hypothetical protein
MYTVMNIDRVRIKYRVRDRNRDLGKVIRVG